MEDFNSSYYRAMGSSAAADNNRSISQGVTSNTNSNKNTLNSGGVGGLSGCYPSQYNTSNPNNVSCISGTGNANSVL